MSQVFHIGDPHIGHRNICKYRPQFADPQEHDENFIDNWNGTVRKKHDTVWVHGDFLIKNDDYDMNYILSRLNGTIKVIPGNHDYMPYYPKGMVWNGLHSKYGYWLSHAPIHPDELRGKKNIHGHVHEKLIKRVDTLLREVVDERYICVCCEHVNYTPISLEEIRGR